MKLTMKKELKTIGVPGVHLQQGFPKLSLSENQKTIDVELVYFREAVPAFNYGDPFYMSGFDRYNAMTDLILISYTEQPVIGSETVKVSLQYGLDPDTSDQSQVDPEVTQEITLNTQDTDIPIEQHEGYLVRWNYDLWGIEVVKNAAIGVWNESKETFIYKTSPGATQKPEAICLKPGELPDDNEFVKLESCVMPGVTSYRRGTVVVSVVRRSLSYGSVSKAIQADYTCKNPPKTFGLSGQWLRGGSKLEKNGARWVHTQDYLLAPDGWRSELYLGGTKGGVK